MNNRAIFNEINNNQKERIDKVREIFSDIYDWLENNCKGSRETSLAFTKLEEAQFWAIKGISREEE